jgi:hypothetical protein
MLYTAAAPLLCVPTLRAERRAGGSHSCLAYLFPLPPSAGHHCLCCCRSSLRWCCQRRWREGDTPITRCTCATRRSRRRGGSTEEAGSLLNDGAGGGGVECARSGRRIATPAASAAAAAAPAATMMTNTTSCEYAARAGQRLTTARRQPVAVVTR